MWVRSALVAMMLMVISLFGLATAHAQGNSIFVVPEVTVFAEASSAAEAQKIAQAQGRRKAMDLLLRRLTAEEDWVYLPKLSQGKPADAGSNVPERVGDAGRITAKQPVILAPEDLALYEEGFAIFDEKTSPTTYRARITYRFKPDGIRQLLQRAGLPYSEAVARKALILPILETDTGIYLWETRNPWAQAWLARPLGNELTPLVLPRGDREDFESAPVAAVRALDGVVLGPLATRYRAPQVIIAYGRLKRVDNQYQFSVRLIDAFVDGRSGPSQITPESAAALYDSADGFGAAGSARSDSDAGAAGRVLAQTFFRGPVNDFPAIAQRAVESTVAKYAKGWKQQTLVDQTATRPLQLVAWFGSLDEWADIRRALESSPLVRELKVGAFNNENAVMQLTVIGEQNQFVLAMRQVNLSVWQGPNGAWHIAAPARAQDLRTRLEDVSLLERALLAPGGSPLNAPGDAGYGLGGDIPELPADVFGVPSDAAPLDAGEAAAPTALDPETDAAADDPLY